MLKFDYKFTPKIFGLQNNSALCYLNSLIQSLMSCSGFNYILTGNEFKNNRIVIEYLNLFNRNKLELNLKYNRIGEDNAYLILKELNLTRNKSGNLFNLSLGSQEDVHEGLILLLDSIGNGIERIFFNRYKSIIFCRNCKKTTKPELNSEPPELIIDLSGEKINSKKDMENSIRKIHQYPEDYKCENCGVINQVQNGIIQKNIIQIYQLVRLSEIIVILFKKYNRKKKIFFSNFLDFKSITGNLKYKLVAQIEHSGNMFGGHYTARCLRQKPWKYHERKKIKYEKIKKTLEEKLKTNPDSETKNKIQQANEIINQCYQKMDNFDGVFLFNDETITESEFEVSESSYLLFYHLISEN